MFERPTDPWEIRYGEVREGGGVSLAIDQDDVKVFEIDFNTKYAEIFIAAYDDDFTGIAFNAGERTLRIDESKKGEPTVLLLQEKWSLIAECTRYSAYVCAYKPRGSQ